MVNKILTAITNRLSFATATFPRSTTTLPALPDDVEHVRKLLKLDYYIDDYFVVGALAAIDAFPHLKEGFGEDVRSFRLLDYQRPLDQWTVLHVGGHEAPTVRRIPTEFPVTFDITFDFVDSTNMRATVGVTSFIVPVRPLGTILEPAWPAELGITGALDLQAQAWDNTFHARLRHVPSGYPYAVVAGILDDDTTKNTLLLASGLLLQYMRAVDPVEKVATVLTALGLSNPNV